MTHHTQIAAAAAVFAALAAGCSNNAGPSPADGYYALTEPKFALADAEKAFNAKDGPALGATLADHFRFYFDAADVGKQLPDGYVIPASWSRDDFLRAATNLFARTHSDKMDAGWRTLGSPAAGEKSFAVDTVPLAFTVMYNPQDGYFLDDGTCDYGFAADDAGKWRLTEWRDRSHACGCPTVEKSFGYILAEYYL